jgi:CII-binding regulator of phage lambda lysogenization HflD
MQSRLNSRHHFFSKPPFYGVTPFQVAFGSNETNLIFSLIGKKDIVEASAKEIALLLETRYITEESIFQSLNDSIIQYDIYITCGRQLKNANNENLRNEELITVYEKIFSYLGRKIGYYFDPTQLQNTFIQDKAIRDKKLARVLFTAAFNARSNKTSINENERKTSRP